MTVLPSIRQRLSRALIGISLAWGVAVAATVWLVVRSEVDELLDSTLEESAEILHGLLSFNAGQLPLREGASLPKLDHHERLVWQIVDPAQNVLLRSYQAPELALAPQRAAGLSSVTDDWRVYGMPMRATGDILYVAQRGSDRRKARLVAATFSAGAALVIGMLCAAWLRSRVRQELEPITSMSTDVTHFDPVRLDSFLKQPTRAELVPMHDAISDLGTRLAKRLANERAFSAHAAHALRTPLAGMVAQLAVAQRTSPPEAQLNLTRAREAADRLRRVVTALLTMFRTGGDVKWQAVDIADIVAHLPFETLSVTTDEPANIHADPDLIAAALLNLFDNSLRNGATMVWVTARCESDGTRIAVYDDGTGIPEFERERLQVALDSQNYEGQTGLGLMLADLVARAHGGQLRLLQISSGCLIEMGLGLPADIRSHATTSAAADVMKNPRSNTRW